MSSVSGLSDAHRQVARNMARDAAYLALAHRDAVHYTQGPLRWQGIDEGRKAWRGQFPNYADCSAFATWCIWNGLAHFGVRDTVNGDAWRAGYTGTMLGHGKRVVWRANVLAGDCVIYGSGWPGEHTALCVGDGMVISHGSDEGPFLLPIDYRGGVMSIRRYI